MNAENCTSNSRRQLGNTKTYAHTSNSSQPWTCAVSHTRPWQVSHGPPGNLSSFLIIHKLQPTGGFLLDQLIFSLSSFCSSHFTFLLFLVLFFFFLFSPLPFPPCFLPSFLITFSFCFSTHCYPYCHWKYISVQKEDCLLSSKGGRYGNQVASRNRCFQGAASYLQLNAYIS